MSIECYEGGAGTGKTHSLIVALERRLTTTPLEDGQSVLAITFMHGSRHRLASRLRALRAARGRHECMTIDSLAWHLVCRWRGLLAAIGTDVRNLPGWSFDQRCEGAASLLANGSVRRWFCRRFPIVIVDELQDVRGSRLAVVKSLAADAHLIAAADGFQDLGALGDSESVAWLRDAATPTVLTQSHRTACADLLASAAAIRAGQVIADRPLCKLISAPNPNAAAGIAACNLTWFGIAGTVVLTPTGPSSSQFVRAVVGRLQEKAIKPKALKGTAVGPFRIDWEARVSDDAEALIQSIGFEPGQADVDARSIRVTLDVRGGRQLQEWIDHQRRVCGRDRIQKDELEEQAKRACQQLRSMSPVRDDRLVAMTSHQAKNREFERVIVLWPYEVSGAPEKLRRLLYNGITRAKQRATIIVQNPPTARPSRLALPPFAV